MEHDEIILTADVDFVIVCDGTEEHNLDFMVLREDPNKYRCMLAIRSAGDVHVMDIDWTSTGEQRIRKDWVFLPEGYKTVVYRERESKRWFIYENKEA